MATEGGQGKVCCLYRLDGFTTLQLIRLDDKEKVTLGRHVDNDIVLNESATVSRRHVLVEKKHGAWNLQDLGSSNGIWVNGVRLGSNQLHKLQDQDVVEIGKDPNSPVPAVYRYRFYKQARIQREPDGTSEDASCAGVPEKPVLRRMREVKDVSEREKEQKQLEAEERLREMEIKLAEKEAEQQKLQQVELGQRALQEKLNEKLQQREEALKAAEAEQIRSKEENKKEHEAIQTKLQQELQQQQEQLKLKEDEQLRLQLEKETLQGELEKHRVQHEAAQLDITQRLEAAEANKDLAIVLYEEETRRLEEASAREVQMREALQKEMEEKLKEKDEEMSAELKTKIEALTVSLTTKETEQTSLREQLTTMKMEVEEEKRRQVKVKEEVEGAMEDELVCSICSELLVQATSLNCSHSFCAYCIKQWMKVKKICPNCRKNITSSVRSLVLDNYIDKVTKVLSKEMQEHREKLVEERKMEQERWDAQQKQTGQAARRAPRNPVVHPAQQPPQNPGAAARLPQTVTTVYQIINSPAHITQTAARGQPVRPIRPNIAPRPQAAQSAQPGPSTSRAGHRPQQYNWQSVVSLMGQLIRPGRVQNQTAGQVRAQTPAPGILPVPVPSTSTARNPVAPATLNQAPAGAPRHGEVRQRGGQNPSRTAARQQARPYNRPAGPGRLYAYGIAQSARRAYLDSTSQASSGRAFRRASDEC